MINKHKGGSIISDLQNDLVSTGILIEDPSDPFKFIFSKNMKLKGTFNDNERLLAKEVPTNNEPSKPGPLVNAIPCS